MHTIDKFLFIYEKKNRSVLYVGIKYDFLINAGIRSSWKLCKSHWRRWKTASTAATLASSRIVLKSTSNTSSKNDRKRCTANCVCVFMKATFKHHFTTQVGSVANGEPPRLHQEQQQFAQQDAEGDGGGQRHRFYSRCQQAQGRQELDSHRHEDRRERRIRSLIS